MFIWFSIVLIIAIVIEGLSYVLTKMMKDKARLSTFECGFDAFDSSREDDEITFYLIGILFIVMDVEALFLYPWLITWWSHGYIGVLGLLDFLIELILCLTIIWFYIKI